MPDLPLEIRAIAIAITLFAGFVKGAVGFAMPLIMVSGLGLIKDPRLAVAAIIRPIVVSRGLRPFAPMPVLLVSGLNLLWKGLAG